MKYYLLLIVTLILGCNSEKPINAKVGPDNAMWCQSIYLRGYNPTTGEALTNYMIKSFAATLQQHKIKYVYLFAGPYMDDGHLPLYPFSEKAANTVYLLQKLYPDLKILPWVGGVQNKTIHLEDPHWVVNALNDTRKLIQTLKTPGVHLDFEYIEPGDPYLDLKNPPGTKESELKYGNQVNDFLKKFRQQNPKAFISTVVVSSSPGSRPWKRKTTLAELDTLIKSVDQLSFLYYDTQINEQKIFEENCAALLKDIQSLKLRKDIQYLVAAGTFINEPELRKFRNMKIENLPNTLNTIKRTVLAMKDKKGIVSGLAIYCDWETDENEWADYDKYWLNKSKS